jgi:hypothetical protein
MWLIIVLLIWRQFVNFRANLNELINKGMISFSQHPLLGRKIEETFSFSMNGERRFAIIASSTCPYCIDAVNFVKEKMDPSKVISLLAIDEKSETNRDEVSFITYINGFAPEIQLVKIDYSVFQKWDISMFPLILEISGEGDILNLFTLKVLMNNMKRVS